MTQHTAGPWKQFNNGLIVQDSEGHSVATAFARTESRENARLIAAAPELLSALEEALHCISTGCAGETTTIIDKATALIARAKGHPHD